MRLSKRLLSVAEMCIKGNMVADIGTDHGYLPIYLVKNGISPGVIATDVRRGPLEHAKRHIEQYGVEDNIEIRLSDGLNELIKDEVKTITICGMGGGLIERIIMNGIDKISSDTQLIMSPQSEIRDFREFLYNNGFLTIMENMIKEDGKYYCIMDCRYLGKRDSYEPSEIHFRYGKYLLDNRNEVLKEYLIKEKNSITCIIDELQNINNSEIAADRLMDLKRQYALINEALQLYT